MSKHKHTPAQGFATRAIHEAYNPQDAEGALTPPVHFSSTFAFDKIETGAQCFAGEKTGHIYSRISNPTLDLLEQRVASLENAEAAVAFGSGMGAITACLWTLLSQGDEILVDSTLYGCTFAFLHEGLSRFGVSTRHVNLRDPSALEDAIGQDSKVLLFESPANPTMALVDIAAVSDIAHRHGLTVIVDNTYASPYITRPIDHGADIVVHSATKYLGGHGDLIAGVAVGTAEMMQRVRLEGLKDLTGAAMAPLTAMLIMRGLKTLELRMQRHSKSARKVAKWLQKQNSVDSVYYPGLKSHPQHALAARQMDLPGGMIAFELKGGVQQGLRFMDSLNMIQRAVSLGDAESLIQHPASMTHSTYSAEERHRFGIGDGLVRLSVGLEAVDDIIADLEQGFRAANQPITTLEKRPAA